MENPLGRCEVLLPRLPDEITLDRIVPKLPWRTFHILARVSRAWRKAIGDHRVHNARIHSCSTDTLLAHCHNYNTGIYRLDNVSQSRIAIYSVRDKLCYDLPPIPGRDDGIPLGCECVSLDGKIYVLGGARPRDEQGICRSRSSSSMVYVLDLAGASHWKECANMENGRQGFGCATLDGKIYVCGGIDDLSEPVRGAEVYDPKVNAWSPIAPMKSLQSMRFNHRVFTGKQKLFVHGGGYYHPSYITWKANGRSDPSGNHQGSDSFVHEATSVDVYDPVKDSWTEDKSFSDLDPYMLQTGSLFVARGKFHAVHTDCISVRSGDGSWTHLSDVILPETDEMMVADRVLAVVVNDELLASADYSEYGKDASSAILQSEGLGTGSSEVVWNVVCRCPGAVVFVHCIQI